jgi:MoaA/NifB/PqqE/SkfB family radical SAM enzyme
MMKLSGLHILLTYQCTYECDHCFVWGSPWQSGVLSLEQIRDILQQAKEAGVSSIYFEGGEPFLYYVLLLKGVQLAADMGFEVGIVSNAYWATSVEDATEWLRPFVGRLVDLTVSSDVFHCGESLGEKEQNALVAAKWLGIPRGVISIAEPESISKETHGQIEGQGAVMFKGRAASQLVSRAKRTDYRQFTECPHEDLREPGRIHLDPFGNLHICQGVVIGNLFEKPLKEICESYDAESHPICGPLLNGGPVALVEEYALPHDSDYADACHLCYEARLALRPRFPEFLKPDQMYGVIG